MKKAKLNKNNIFSFENEKKAEIKKERKKQRKKERKKEKEEEKLANQLSLIIKKNLIYFLKNLS